MAITKCTLLGDDECLHDQWYAGEEEISFEDDPHECPDCECHLLSAALRRGLDGVLPIAPIALPIALPMEPTEER